jgi:hypothetical protein
MRVIFCFLLAFGLFSCRKDEAAGCLDSSGPVSEEIRLLSPFKSLRIEENLNVTWHDSTAIFMKLRCGKNLMPGITSRQSGDELLLANQNRCNWVRRYDLPMEIDLWCPAPWLIRLAGFGEFHCADSLNAGLLTLQCYGAGKAFVKVAGGLFYCDFAAQENVELSGYADAGVFAIQNTGKLDASSLEMRKLEIDMKGENDVLISVRDSLSGVHKSHRKVILKGQPAQSVQFLSTGRIEGL